MVSDVPRTNAAWLFEVRGEEIVDDGLVLIGSGQRRGGGQRGRVVGGPRRSSRAVSDEQKCQQPQPGGGRPPFAHFHRRAMGLRLYFTRRRKPTTGNRRAHTTDTGE